MSAEFQINMHDLPQPDLSGIHLDPGIVSIRTKREYQRHRNEKKSEVIARYESQGFLAAGLQQKERSRAIGRSKA